MVILCLAGDVTGDGTGVSCGTSGEGRTIRDEYFTQALAFGTSWVYGLTTADITAMGEGPETLIAISTDAAGNTSEGSVGVTVDTTVPAVPTLDIPIADDDIINAEEQSDGIILTGGKTADVVDVRICFGGTASLGTTLGCTGGLLRTAEVLTGTTWRYEIPPERITLLLDNSALTQGGTSTLIVIGADAAGNAVATPSVNISVDTIVPVFTSGNSGAVGVNAAIDVIAYDANATDNGGDSEAPDTGLTYSLSGDDAGMFTFNAVGEVTYRAVQTDPVTHNIIITATDTAGNASAPHPVTISVLTGPMLTITDDVPGILIGGRVNPYIPAIVTFTFSFAETVTGFSVSDCMPLSNCIVVNGLQGPADGSLGALTETTDGQVWTLAVTAPRFVQIGSIFRKGSDNLVHSGGITVTVLPNIATGTVTGRRNIVGTTTQEIDTKAPFAVFFETVSIDNIINAAERDNGVTITGTTDDDTAEVRICFSPEVAICDDFSNLNLATLPTATTWAYAMTDTDFTTFGESSHNVIGYAADSVGNISAIGLRVITIDTIAPDTPPTFDAVSTDGIITAAERAADVTIGGSKVADVTAVTLCLGATGDTCGATADADITSATAWSYTLLETDYTAFGEGALIFTATGTDAAGNPSTVTATPVTVDTLVPVFTAGDTVTSNIAVNTAFAYDAAAGDNGVAGEIEDFGVTYAHSGTHAGLFTIAPDTGVVTYITAPTGAVSHTITITATDAVGNSATQDVTIEIILDDTTVPSGSTAAIPLDIDRDSDFAESDTDNALLTLPAGHTVTQVTVSTPPATATSNPPTGVAFGVTTDIALNAALPGGETATVCLPTTGLTTSRAALYHYTSSTWNEIGRDTTTRTDAVCGTTATFSPFAAGEAVRPTVAAVVAPRGFYKADDIVPITVTFFEAVTVSGTPQLALSTGNAGDGVGTYTSGSGTADLTFTYRVRDGDNIGAPQTNPDDPNIDVPVSLNDLDYTGTTALTLNGGTIRSNIEASLEADLTLPVPGENGSLSSTSDVVLDTIAPTADSAAASADGASIEVTASEMLMLTNLDFLDGGEFILTNTFSVVQFPFNFGTLLTLVVDPPIQPGEENVMLAWTAGSNDIIADLAGNILPDFTSLSVNTGAVAPVVTAVALVPFSALNNQFSAPYNKAGDSVNIVVSFSSPVAVTGTPQLTLATGSSPNGMAEYVSGAPGTELLFRYTVLDGHNSAALGYPDVNALGLNGGMIQSTIVPATAANLTLPAPGEIQLAKRQLLCLDSGD